MARFLFAATPAAGHVNPALPIIRALTGAGHQVLLTSGPDFAGAAEAAGARFVPIPPDASIDASTLDERYPARAKLTGARLIRHDLVHFFTAPAAAQARHEGLRTQRPRPDALRTAVRQVLDTPSYAARARELAARAPSAAAPGRAADLLAALAATGRPVRRELSTR